MKQGLSAYRQLNNKTEDTSFDDPLDDPEDWTYSFIVLRPHIVIPSLKTSSSVEEAARIPHREMIFNISYRHRSLGITISK